MRPIEGITLDISEHDEPYVDGPCFRAAGVRRVHVNVRYEAVCRRQVSVLRAAGIHIQSLYAFLMFGSRAQTVDLTRRAVRMALDLGVRCVSLDAEADAKGAAPTVEQRNAELRACVGLVRAAGLEPMIYTAGWWWRPRHGDTREFEDVPLWLAFYGANDGTQRPIRNLSELGRHSFRGWDYCVVHQYTSTAGLCGRANRDRNHTWPDAPGLEEEDMGMTPEESARLARLEALLAGNGFRTDEGDVVTGEEALALAEELGISTILSIQNQQAALRTHIDDVAQHTPGGLPEHKHIPGGIQS